jgi:glucose/arabinose dehydrogenase
VAKDALVAAAADGKITANEQADVAKSLQTLMGQIQSGQALYSGNMRDLISLQKNLMRDQMQTAILMQQLKAQAQQHSTKLNQIFSRVR